jgi:hypothetical protein
MSLLRWKAASDINALFKNLVVMIRGSLNRRALLLMLFTVIMASVLGLDRTAQAQSSSQVTVVGVPPILPTPFANDLENSFVTGQYQIIFNYTSFTQQPVDFVFNFSVFQNNRRLIDIQSMPSAFTPGTYVFTSFFEELIFPQSADDVFRQLDGAIRSQIIQTGTLPEGEYSIVIEARPATSQSNIATLPGSANFSVRYPQPPIPVSPPNGSNVTLGTPVFSWTPVVNTAGIQMSYDFLLVEVLPGQTPLQAINSNREHALETLVGNTTLPYTLQYLPLDPGAEYAWQITASDVMGNVPLQNDGKTEIQSFTYMAEEDGDEEFLTDLSQLDEITLVPQFATLISLGNLNATETADSYILNGEASLQLEFTDFGTFQTAVELNDVAIQKQSLINPVLMGGSLTGIGDQLATLFSDEQPILNFEEISWSFGQNVMADVSLNVPGGESLIADAALTLTPEGLSGTAEVSGDPLVQYNSEYLSMELFSLGVSFPENRSWATGNATVSGMETPCEISNYAVSDTELSAEILCNEPFTIPLVDESDFMVLEVDRVMGNLSLNTEHDDFAYDVELRSKMGLKTAGDEYCGANLLVDITNDEGMTATAIGDSCPEFNPKMDLGFSSLLIEDTEFGELSYASATDEWSFELGLDAQVEIDAFDQWTSLTMNDIVITREGIEFGGFDFEEGFNITSMPVFNTPLLQLELSLFSLNEFIFPLFDWDREGPGPWDISFGGNATIRSGSGAPESMVGQELEVSNGRVDQDRVISGISLPDDGNFEWNFGTGYSLVFTTLDGIAGIEYLEFGEIRPFGELNLGGEFLLGAPFNCGEEQMFQFEQEALSLSEGFAGRIENVVPECPLQIGPFHAQVIQSTIDFTVTPDGAQQAIMDADAVITMPNGLEVDGIVQINLMTGEFIEASFIIDEPFDWHIRSAEAPVLTFHLDYAELSEDGFFVDGRQSFALPDTSMGVTFDNFLYDLQTGSVTSGRVIFDDSFGFEVGIAADMQDLTFQPVAGGSELSFDPGLLMELGSTTYIDSLGFSSSGAAIASIAFNEQRFDSLVVAEYGENFRMSLNPFGISAGQVDFFFDDAHFAYLDPSGFHPVMSFFTDYLIPERLPLPNEDIAYLQLREGDSLLVDITPLEDGNIMISTPPDTSLDLVVPYFNPSSPAIIGNVTLNDVVISPNPFYAELVSGTIVADLPQDDPTLFQYLQAQGIPLTPHYLEYGIQDVNGTPTKALFLKGNLSLFGQELQSDEPSEFYVRGDGYVRADINATGMDAPISLAAEDRVIFNINALDGSFEMAIGSGNPVYDFDVSGSLEILTDQGYQSGADLTIRHQPGYAAITNFTGYELDPSPTIGLGGFGLGLDQIVSLEDFSYSTLEGFQYAIVLNGHFNTGFSNGEQLSVPFREIEFRNNGIYIPPQDINESSIPGINLPQVNISGFEFGLLAFRTLNGITYTWGEGGEFDPDFSMDFTTNLPEFEQFGLIPPDGLLFTNVGFQEGFLVGEMEPFTPLSPILVPVSSGENSPILQVEEIAGSLEVVEEDGAFQQSASFSISGEVAQIPIFSNENSEPCTESTEFSLEIVQGEFFEGIINNIQPCGSIPLGPLSLEMTNADLFFSHSEDSQTATFDGAADVTLPGQEGQPPIVVSGELAMNALTGEISDGSISINEPFNLALPFGAENPLFALTINQAILDMDGLMIDGQGSLVEGDVNADVTFDDLRFDLSTMEILDGSASVNSNLAIQFAVNPLGFQLVDSDSPMPDGNALRLDLTGNVLIDEAGLGFSGTSIAELQFEGQNFSNLRVEWLDNVAMNFNGTGINRGIIEFYWDQGSQLAQEPIAWIDENGFHTGVGLVALVPDRLPLPTQDIAYIQLRDENGDPYIEPESTENGYTFSTNGEFLPIVFAAFSLPGDTLTAGVSFTLTTDDAFNITDGEMELEDDIDLSQMLGLPVSLTNLALSSENGLSLEAGLRFDLPSIFQNMDESASAEVFATLNQNGIESGEFYIEADPIVEVNISGSGDLSGDAFSATLTRIEALFGEENSVSFEGTLNSSLVMNDEDEPLAFSSSWADNAWNFAIEPYQQEGLTFGSTTFQLDDESPLSLYADHESFYMSINGQVSFEDLLAEPVLVTVQDLQVGVNNIQISPSLLFDIGDVSGELGDQQFGLFDNAVLVSLIDPTIALNGRDLAITSDGNIEFLEQEFGYQDLMISTSGDLSIGDVSISAVNIFEEYLVLQSFGLNFENGIRVESELELTLPAPADEYTATGNLAIYRDDDGEIVIDQGGLQFDLENERFELLEFGEFELSKVGVQINPFEWENAGLFANGQIYLNSDPDPILEFGEASNFPNNPGIGISMDANQVQLQYNITGNPAFEYELSFFTIAVSADITGSSENGFEIMLAGQAGMNLESVEAELAYGGIIVTEEGLVDYGNIEGGSISVAGVASLTVGQFIYQKDENGFTINLADTEEKGPEELQQNGDFSSAEVAKNSVDVVELLCFGPCPEIGADSDFEALSLSISADTGSDSGGIQGGVDRVMFYRTAAGLRSLTIENANIEMDNVFEMSASINYVQENEGVLLRAAATGNFGGTVGALVAGKFSNFSGDVSFGLFVAVETSAGIPIVPGIVTLTGAGGGFFYKPVQDDLDIVQSALGSFGHELVDPEAAQIQGEADFAVMLYASVGIAGTAGQYVVEGSTFFQITSQSFYMDARVNVLGMDGENSVAQTEVEGTLSASIQRNPFAMSIGIDVGITVPFVLEGGGGIQYFMNEQESEIVWGIIGYADFELFGGVMNGGGNFLAGNPGVMLEVYLGFELDIAIIQVQSQLTGSVWMITDPSYSYPFGAYIIFDVEASLMGLASVAASAQAAFLTRNPSGYIFFASVHGCVGTPLGDACGSAWASYASQDGLDFGLGHHANANLIAEAQAQMDQFEEHIYALMSGIPGALESLETTLEPNFEIQTAEDARMAGQHFYGMSQYTRSLWDEQIHDPETIQSLPQALRNVRQNVMLSQKPQFASTAASQHQLMAQTAIDILTGLESEISADMITAQELSDYAEEQYENLITSMSESPVRNVQKPAPSLSATQSVDFEVDDQLAGQQISNSEEYRSEMEQLDTAIQNDIRRVIESLDEMSALLQTDNPSSEDNNLINLAHWYGRVHMEMEKYFAYESDRFNKEVSWANGLLGYLNSNETSIQNASESISNEHISLVTAAFATRQNASSANGDVNDFARRFANRNHFIFKLKQDTPGSPFLAQPGSGYDLPTEIQQIYNNLSTPIYAFNNADRENIRQSNLNFWWEMNHGGLTEFRDNRMAYLVDGEMISSHDEYREQIMAPLRDMTGILDDFYTIKANTTSILYNMIDEYVHWRPEEGEDRRNDELAMSGNQFNGYTELRDFLAEQLLPPQITDIRLIPDNSGNFYNRTDLEWDATHRDRVVETAISVDYGSSNAVNGGFMSIGNRRDFTLYPYKRDMATNIEEIDFSVRVRGSGGNTAVRRASFTVAIDPDTPPSMITSSGSVVPAQTNPPPRPNIDLRTFYNSAQSDFGQAFWTNSTDNIMLLIQANDPEVGIGRWEYSIGTSPGESDVIEWSTLQGQLQNNDNNTAQSMTGPARSFVPEPGVPYYISVRVENTLGQVSPVQASQTPIVYDNTIPSYISFDRVLTSTEQPESSIRNTFSPISQLQPYQGTTETRLSWTDKSDQRLHFRNIEAFVANPLSEAGRGPDAPVNYSGISYFEYTLSGNGNMALQQFEQIAETFYESELIINNPNFEIGEDIYWHIRAVDNAGNRGEINTFGPFQLQDYSLPLAGELRAIPEPGGVKLFVIDPPFDPESDLIGVQYAIATRDHLGSVIRPFPDGEQVDLEWNFQRSLALHNSSFLFYDRYVSIPEEELRRVGRDPFYILYRSINTLGMTSDVYSTGPLVVDGSPPLQSDIDVQYNYIMQQGTTVTRYRIFVDDIRDPESGILKVEYWIERRSNSNDSWGDISSLAGFEHFVLAEFDEPRFDGVRLNPVYSPPLNFTYPNMEYRVKVRITNGSGVSTVQTAYPN